MQFVPGKSLHIENGCLLYESSSYGLSEQPLQVLSVWINTFFFLDEGLGSANGPSSFLLPSPSSSPKPPPPPEETLRRCRGVEPTSVWSQKLSRHCSKQQLCIVIQSIL